MWVAVLNVQDTDLPYPEIQGITDIEKLLLAAQLKIAASSATGASSVTIKFLSVDANDETQVLLPTQHTQEDVVEVGDLYIIWYGDHPHDNRTDVV
jgi:hypothetical protein